MEDKFCTKQDYVKYRETLIAHLKNTELDFNNFQQLLKIVDDKLATYKDEVDKIVEEVTGGEIHNQ